MNFLEWNHVIALFLTSLASFIVGMFVLLKGKERKNSITYSMWSLSVALWSFFMAMSVISSNPQESIFWWHFMWSLVMFIPVSTSHFVISFLDIKNKKIFLWIGYILSLFFFIASFTKYMVSSVRSVVYLRYWADPTPLVNFLWIPFGIYVLFQLYCLFKAYQKSTSVIRNQTTYIFWASVFGYVGGCSNINLVYDIYIPIFNPFANYFIIIYSLIVGAAILKYQLMDIKIMAQRALFYSVGISLASGGVVGISFLSNWFAQKIPGFNAWTVPVATGSIAFIIGRIFWNKSKEVDKLKYEFITVAAHKLRTPLTEIKWGIEAIKDETNEKGLALLNEINNSASRLLVLSDELLSVSKAEASQYQYKFELVNIKELTEEVVRDFRNKIKEKNIELVLNIKENLPKIKLDKMRMSSVIQILLENAVNYTKNKINITIIEDEKDLLFSIEDNGIGIKKEDIPYIFSQFYRTHEAYLTETEGSGIGLFLAKKIIEKHSGKISVQSEGKGKGSEFWFKLKIE